MPQRSKREICITQLGDAVVSHSIFADTHKLLIDNSDWEEDSDDDEMWNTKVLAAIQYAAVTNFRYLFRETKYRPDIRGKRLGYGMPEWRKIVLGYKYNEEEFLKIFCIPRDLFRSFAAVLKNHRAFQKRGLKQRKHFSSVLHLLVLLKYMGSEGNAASLLTVKQGLGIGKGSVKNYLERAVDAVLSLFNDTVFWPGEEERTEIAVRIREKHHFPKCVGFVDGTHLGLAFKPELDGEDYWTRKQSYAVSAMVVCDDFKRIRYLNLGWPGSVHDQRIYQNSSLNKKPNLYFVI